MLAKNDLSVVHAAYVCSTGARYAQPHPSPADIYSAALQFKKASTKSIDKAFKGSNAAIMQVIQTIPWLSSSPWYNTNMSNISLHPLISNFGRLALGNGLIPIHQNPSINPFTVSSLLEHLQYHLQTSDYGNSLEQWATPYESSEKELNSIFRNIEQSSSGFELQEFIVNYDAAQNGTLQFDNLKKTVSNEIKNLISSDKCLTIFLKKEPNLNQKMNLRYICILQKDFIDEPSTLTGFDVLQNLKYIVETNSCYTVIQDSGRLNEFLFTNFFSKKSPNYRERIRCLKNYLIGTDALYRVDGLQTSCEILYSKFI